MLKNYYYILGVEHSASQQEIKSAYKKLAKKFHPDTNAGDKFFEKRFKDIQEAYEVLSHDLKRQRYDNQLNGVKSLKFYNTAIKKIEEELRQKYASDLQKIEEEIRQKYQMPEQGEQETEDKLRKPEEHRKAQEVRRQAERKKVVDEIRKRVTKKRSK
jgi:curved DNA-binding protein CbpA